MDWKLWLPIILGGIQAIYTVLGYYRDKSATSYGVPVMRRRYVVMGVLLLLTWAAVGFDYYDRHFNPQQSATAPISSRSAAESAILLGWGGAVPSCGAQVNGRRLLELRDKYAVAIVCGVPQGGVDRFEDKKITISPLYTIIAETISIQVTHSSEMEQQVKGEIEKLLKLKGMSELPTGVTVNVAQWYEVVVLPKQTDVSGVHRLSDVVRYGGKILSQEGYDHAGAVFQG